MYNPADYNGINGTEFEFIEIKNVGNVNVDLSSLRIVDAVDFTFEAGALLEPQSFFVIAANSTQFQLKYGRAPSGVFSVTQFHISTLLTLNLCLGQTE